MGLVSKRKRNIEMPNQPTESINVESEAISIYSGGSLTEISESDLLNNQIAIRQLVNNHNLVQKRLHKKDEEISSYKSEIEYLKTSPYISIFSSISAVISTILVGLGMNLLTSVNSYKFIGVNIGWLLIIFGGILTISSSLSNILYPFAKKWFNK